MIKSLLTCSYGRVKLNIIHLQASCHIHQHSKTGGVAAETLDGSGAIVLISDDVIVSTDTKCSVPSISNSI